MIAGRFLTLVIYLLVSIAPPGRYRLLDNVTLSSEIPNRGSEGQRAQPIDFVGSRPGTPSIWYAPQCTIRNTLILCRSCTPMRTKSRRGWYTNLSLECIRARQSGDEK